MKHETQIVGPRKVEIIPEHIRRFVHIRRCQTVEKLGRMVGDAGASACMMMRVMMYDDA
jgi:hypothetical protein